MINYYCTTNINLSCEKYTNAGLTFEEIKSEIELIRDPGHPWLTLSVSRSGINDNPTIRTSMTDYDGIDMLVRMIEYSLTDLLYNKENKDRHKEAEEAAERLDSLALSDPAISVLIKEAKELAAYPESDQIDTGNEQANADIAILRDYWRDCKTIGA